MEALTIDEIISAKKNFLNIDKDLNLIHSVNETKETYYWEYPKVCVNLQTDVR